MVLDSILPALLQALEVLHKLGRGHCDLKPANVRVGINGDLTVGDVILLDMGSSAAFCGRCFAETFFSYSLK